MPSNGRRTRRTLLLVAALCGALSAGGCARSDDPAGRTRPATVEEIASAIGCTAQVSLEADELRQGGCETGQGAYRVTTFADGSGLRSWLAETRAYGGTYLVGNRWVVTAPTPESLTALRARLGGALETTTPHSPHGGMSH
ncbi:hypothetical protein OOK31_03770 [Streptomyces sp. NBC_00249]|uniref:hypothetical protein n=1 Tax=Streptomyces sp. NBC_00249 TaxID=2975690 RepID=UPI0022567B45|nr:hypothetical protein [Streptomyces sp. NBC_00249]MCX5193018.1 hypothetical protein [Streptomyces sp. NBC_00249]